MPLAPRPPLASRLETGHQLLLLAPLRWKPQGLFADVVADESAYSDLLSALQRFRGSHYLRDGALRPEDLTPDLRHQQPIDPHSWHFVIQSGPAAATPPEIVSCARYYSLPQPCFEATLTSRSWLANQPHWRPRVRSVVDASIRAAADRGANFAELGGWCVAESARKTSHALRSVLSMYALGELLGGTVGLSTATTRHSSSSILQRLGAQKADWQGLTLPTYFDPVYDCDMELLQFDSSRPAPKYAAQVAAYQHHLQSSVRVICAGLSVPTCLHSLQSLAGRLLAEADSRPVHAPPHHNRGASLS
jgi:hypothetical protein